MRELVAASHRRPVVVCVDDDPAVLRSLRRLLKRDAYDLVTTDDPLEALGQVRRTPVDILITDERMPGMSGSDLLKEVELKSPGTRRVMISAYPDQTGRLRTDQSLVQHFIPKPWNDDLFRALVRRMVLAREQRPLPEHPEARSAGEEFMREIPVVVDCLGRRILELVPPALRLFRKAKKAARPVLVILESLPSLKEDPAALLADLELAATAAGVEVTLVDSSGLAARYRRLRGDPVPQVSVYGPDSVAYRRKFLLVDPVATRRVFLRLLLDGLGHSCRAVATCEEGREILHSKDFDRVLVDLTDPGSAMDWISELSGEVWKVPVVPLLPASRSWDVSVLERWSLQRPLVRPYPFSGILDLAT